MSQVSKKIKIGFILTGDYFWIGGLYYVLNLLKALALIKNESVVCVALTGKSTPKEILKVLDDYQIIQSNIEVFSFLNRIFNRYPTRVKRQFKALSLDIIFPLLRPDQIFMQGPAKPVFWIPDFQHKFYPEFFSQNEVNRRDEVYSQIASLKNTLILSSKDALSHFEQFYPQYNCKIQILKFRSVIQPQELNSIEMIAKKYPIEKPYFIVCNQFWQHKNHMVVVEAAQILANQGLNYSILLTGKADSQFPQVFDSIQSEITKHNLNNIHLLGFISREDQLQLMQNSLAVIQPSKFEGWSTVIEDAKTLGAKVIASDIQVNREQMKDNAAYFEAESAEQLAVLMHSALINNISGKQNNAHFDFTEYANQLVQLFRSI
jgi:glycosyltransferase involved in cell wall biosynthesis